MFLPYFFPSFLPSFLPSFFTSFLLSFLPSYWKQGKKEGRKERRKERRKKKGRKEIKMEDRHEALTAQSAVSATLRVWATNTSPTHHVSIVNHRLCALPQHRHQTDGLTPRLTLGVHLDRICNLDVNVFYNEKNTNSWQNSCQPGNN